MWDNQTVLKCINKVISNPLNHTCGRLKKVIKLFLDYVSIIVYLIRIKSFF